MFTVGTKVRIRPDSPHYGHGASNPAGKTGVIGRLNTEGGIYDSYFYRVYWSKDGVFWNNYRETDLMPWNLNNMCYA